MSTAILFHVAKTLKARASLQNLCVVLSRLRYNTHIGQLGVTMTKQIFKGQDDRYNGVTVDSIEETCDTEEFVQRLKDSLEQWINDKKRTIWFRVHISHAEWIPILTKTGFTFHHAKEEYAMLYRWLPGTECKVPKYAHTFLGVGACVLNKDKNEILVLRERYKSDIKGYWKLPGGYIEPKEDIEAAILREVHEETGIESDFKCLTAFRHKHEHLFDCSDIYMLALLIPRSFNITKCQREVSECRWMKIDEFVRHPEVHIINKILIQTIIDLLQRQIGILATYEIYPATKKQICVYSVQNITNTTASSQ